MSRIVVYNASWSTFGGGEKYACALARAASLLPGTSVSLLIDVPGITRERLQEFFQVDLQSVTLVAGAGGQAESILAAADLAIIVSNVHPHGMKARRAMYVLQIPYPAITSTTILIKAAHGHVRDAAKDLFRRSLLAAARRADVTVVYSAFVRDVLARHHGITASVLYPPIDDTGPAAVKRPVILSVGRFFRGPYNDKRYDVLIDAFKELCESHDHPSWEYRIVGSCADDPSSRGYLEKLKSAARGYPVTFCVNAPYTDLLREYREASIFWHAAGYGVDEQRHPDQCEHFGMSTVEAMSAECIPVVINAGGQREIVSHGATGYLWTSRRELLAWTETLMDHPSAAQAMRRAARERAGEFSPGHFTREAHRLFHTMGFGTDDTP